MLTTASWCRCALLAALGLCVVLLRADDAHAQRMRFGSQVEDPAAAAGGWTAANRDRRTTTAASSTIESVPATAATSVPSTAPIVDNTITPIYTAPPEPITYTPNVPVPSPALSFGKKIEPPGFLASNWDPYRVATRKAAFAGTITSTPGMPGQFTLPQPMPRVPYYTNFQQGTTAPIVTMPQGQVITQPGVMVAPATVPTAPPIIANPAIPILAPTPVPFAAPVIASNRCFLKADGIYFTRNADVGNVPLVLLDGNAPTESNVLLSTSDLDFDFEFGPRVTLGTNFDEYRSFEATYFGIYDWDYSNTITGDNNLNLPGDLGLAAGFDFFNADSVTVDYDSDIHNAEFNLFRNVLPNLAYLLGFRYFHLGERFSITSTDNATGTSSYDVSTYNNLFGGQLGGRVQQACGNWSYDLVGKAGVYANIASGSQNVSDFDGFTLRNTKANETDVAFIGELGLNGNYRFSRCLSLRGGYQVFWIEGLALAPNQLDFTDTATSGTALSTSGGMFMHGAHAGLMAEW